MGAGQEVFKHVVSKTEVRTFGYGNSLPIVLSVCHSLLVD